jgi:hypothetical protein
MKHSFYIIRGDRGHDRMVVRFTITYVIRCIHPRKMFITLLKLLHDLRVVFIQYSKGLLSDNILPLRNFNQNSVYNQIH